ncbi:zinc finger protein 16-like [Sabethes cyaneus]|uniref:zinc finger protein 16-like n=1 Tax=Sabethes cyaneus TaxID=53552 RepID=UPI00237DF455|nr:zinc finger protein 16-like [Sabethes cyaneus]
MPSEECRICLRHEENCVSLFKQRRGTKLCDILKFCARIEISEGDGLPGDACPRCVDEALNAYLFINKCRRSDAELRTAQACYGDDDEEPGPGRICPEEENTIQICKTNEDTESYHNAISDNATLDFNSAVPNCLDESNDSKTDETERADVNLTKAIEGHHSSTDELAYELKTNVKSELIQQSDEEADRFLVEYLDDDFGTELLVDESMNEIHLESDQYKAPTELKDKLRISGNITEANKYICCGTRCRAVMNTEQQLAEHTVQVHLPDRETDSSMTKAFECSTCYARFKSEKSLSLHTRRSSHCQLCSKLCFSQSEKRLHMRQVHGQLSSPLMTKTSKKICCGCYKSFDNEEDLRKHSLEEHEIRKSAVDESRPFQCDICYKLFRTLESLRIHQRFVYRPKNFTCSTCNRAFDTRSKLTNHSLVHTEQRNYKCDKCDKAFKKSLDLKSHQLLHNDKQEECSICGLRFHRKSNLKMHMRKHQSTFFYACPDCPKQFKNNSHLKEHYKVHTKQKPYNCRFCERRFGYCSDRKRHEMTHTGDYPFECLCLKKFARKTTFDKHISICPERVEINA